MKINYDKESDALYIRFSDSKYFESDEVKDGFILDLDKYGKVIGLEILKASKNLPKESINKVSFELLSEKPLAK
ncbi:MAG: DUF2283 domain-containing protein [Candidatus Diapherotrites archaeon CG08_land_8_20_14_0_20_34_12]|nr:MAG: DUF2283 domain-containing protein [Candidatus Diapherotrites archaeon CG08_land_8_20_14_0_20_34_12]